MFRPLFVFRKSQPLPRTASRKRPPCCDSAIAATGAGSVNTTWRYSTGNRSAARAVSHSRAAVPWHFGQWRLRQLLYAIRWCPAVGTALDVATERRRSGMLRWPPLRQQLGSAQMPGALGDAECIAAVTEDIRHLERRTLAPGHLLGPRPQPCIEIAPAGFWFVRSDWLRPACSVPWMTARACPRRTWMSRISVPRS